MLMTIIGISSSSRRETAYEHPRLPIFISAAEHLNFTKAAEEHHISQTAVSQQIKQLEKELGFQLFVRGNGVSA